MSVTLGTLLSRGMQLLHPDGRGRFQNVRAALVEYCSMRALARTRHLVIRDGEVALSPGWSIHSGCGTRAYSFCWAMGGENQAFADMQGVAMEELR